MTAAPVAWVAWSIDLLLPRRCVACRGPGADLCLACRAALQPVSPPWCARCGAPTAWPVERCRECAGRRLAFSSARAAVAYAGPVRPLVRAWKERGLRHLASLAADLMAQRLEQPVADVITYVPPDPVRQLGRARHPAQALAHELARRWAVPDAQLLRRAGCAQRQTGLPLALRRRNVQSAFVPVGDAPSRVVLVDDVYTTGSTADAAARALRRAGAVQVEVRTFARAVR